MYVCYISGKLVQVNTGDREVLYFEAPRGKQHFLSQQDVEEVEWHSWTCVLGPSIQGVWPPYTDVTDVNAACVSHDGRVIATGDDFGYVKLFQYPSYVSPMPSHWWCMHNCVWCCAIYLHVGIM